ncbi:tRNA methyltransferase 10 homolog C [Ascaphus truei]|uniref:tRNA methyltransferase 10 homolog C n=1 Tax=Ascaphus truei TaxID=8439 RepID=UPI003F5957F0
MRFINTFLRTIGCSTFRTWIKEGGSRWLFINVPHPQSQCRTLILSRQLRNEGTKQDSSEKLDLEEWKNIMRSGIQETANEQEMERQPDSSLTAMRELVEMWRLAGRSVPESISEEQLKVLVELLTKTSRKKYLKYLSIKEGVRKAEKEKKKLRKTKMEDLDQSFEKAGLRNTFFLQFWQKSMDNVQHWKSAQAMTFGQPLVFDMVYENYMSRREMENTVNQFLESEGWNRRSVDPFHIHLCSLQPDGPYHKELVRRYMDGWDKIFVTATEKSHIDVFPRDRLVYLTADSPTELKKFDHDKVYIVGSLVDRCQQTGLSLANAKRLNLATARLPLERYLHWEVGAKNLTIDQMMRILLTLKDTGDWKKALSFVPTRKHDGFVEPSRFQKMNLPKKTKTYEFGKSKTVVPRAAQYFPDRAKQKRWWDEEN